MLTYIDAVCCFGQLLHSVCCGMGAQSLGWGTQNIHRPWALNPLCTSDDKSDAVSISGLKDDVEKCYGYLQIYVRELCNVKSESVIYVPHQFYSHVIGKNGRNIKKIREETNTYINLPREENDEKVTISGKRDDCIAARRMIKEIITKVEGKVKEEIDIPKDLHKYLHHKGQLVSCVQEECKNVTITFPPQDSNTDKVTVYGDRGDVKNAKQFLAILMNEKQQANLIAYLRAKPHLHRILIGHGNAAVRKITVGENSHFVFISGQADDEELIKLVGEKECVQKAQAELQKCIIQQSKGIKYAMSIDLKYRSHFVDNEQKVAEQIADASGGVILTFKKRVKTCRVTIKGLDKEHVAAAKVRILEIIGILKKEGSLNQQGSYQASAVPAEGKLQSAGSECDEERSSPVKNSNTADNEACIVEGEDV